MFTLGTGQVIKGWDQGLLGYLLYSHVEKFTADLLELLLIFLGQELILHIIMFAICILHKTLCIRHNNVVSAATLLLCSFIFQIKLESHSPCL